MKAGISVLGIFMVLILGWQMACDRELVSPLFLPSPWQIVVWLKSAALDGTLFSAMGVTIMRMFTGYLPGLALGLFLGTVVHACPLARATLGWAALGLQTLPSVCWTPLALLWFGQTEAAMRFVVIMGSVWSILIATENAISRVPSLWLKAARIMGFKGMDLWLKVTLPAALPALVSGARLGWAFAWRSLMSAEIYVTILENMGLGQLLHYGRELQAMEQTMGVMLLIIILGVAADKLLFLPLERHLHKTQGI